GSAELPRSCNEHLAPLRRGEVAAPPRVRGLGYPANSTVAVLPEGLPMPNLGSPDGPAAGAAPTLNVTGPGRPGRHGVPLRGGIMPFPPPALPYPFDALEPHIDAKTMEIHSQKHHKAYVDNLNKALESAPEFANLDIVTLLRDIKKVPES